jgi:DUF1009 family protein
MDDGADLAIISGSGKLPLLIKNFYKQATYVTFGKSEKIAESKVLNCDYEKLGFLFHSLKKNGIRRVVMAGAMSRPRFNQSKLDQYTLSIMPKLSSKLVQGDNKLLSFIASEFEKKGYKIVGASEILPDLILKPGFICGTPYEFIKRDIKKADKILKLLSHEDIGQGVAIENGLVLGIETLQGTNELLKFVAKTPAHLRKTNLGGIFVKRPKINQDLRFDMPVIGPETVRLACKAGLGGLVVSPLSVIVLDKERCEQIAKANNFFILAEETTN